MLSLKLYLGIYITHPQLHVHVHVISSTSSSSSSSSSSASSSSSSYPPLPPPPLPIVLFFILCIILVIPCKKDNLSIVQYLPVFLFCSQNILLILTYSVLSPYHIPPNTHSSKTLCSIAVGLCTSLLFFFIDCQTSSSNATSE